VVGVLKAGGVGEGVGVRGRVVEYWDRGVGWMVGWGVVGAGCSRYRRVSDMC
jgi:hypothetical protein